MNPLKALRIHHFLALSALAFAIPMGAQAATDNNTPSGKPQAGCHEHGPGGPMGHGPRGERMFKHLGLNDEQKAKAVELMDKHHEKMRAEHEAFVQEMDKILTPEQREKAKAMREKMEKRMKKHHPEGK